MRPLRLSSGPLLLMVVALMAVTEPAEALLASARRGQSRYLRGPRAAVPRVAGVSQAQCQLVCQQHNCRSFNYHASTGSCEVFTVTACQSYTYYVSHSALWTWFDVVADLSTEPDQKLWQQEACVRDGRCRDSCLRHLVQTCRHTQQCEHLVSGPVLCTGWRCRCAADHWQFNSTLCLPNNQQLFTDGTFWVWKKIVDGFCSTEFDVKAAGGVTIVLADAFTHSSNRYVFTITQASIKAHRIQVNNTKTEIGSSGKNLLSGAEFRRLGMHWCSGQIRFWQAGNATRFINWDDDKAFLPTHLAISSTRATAARWRIPKLVDPWFGDDWSPQRIYSIPRDTGMLRRRVEQDFWVEFDCRVTTDCNWMARQQNTHHNANKVKVIIGGGGNTHSAIHRHVTDAGWQTFSHTSTPAILSATEFRRFRIHFTPAKISVYRADETEPFMTHAVGVPLTINFDGPHMCCNMKNVEFRLVQYDAGWSYEGGFRWGENLVD